MSFSSRLSLAERDRRWAALDAAMAKAGHDALVFVANDHRGHKGPLRYVADYNLYHRFGFVFMQRGAAPELILPTIMADVEPGRWAAAQHNLAHPAGFVADRLAALPDGARVGIIGMKDILRAGDLLLWQARCPGLRLENADALFDAVRLRKSAEEIAGIREAAAIADHCFGVLLDTFRPGETERSINARMLAACAEAGGEDPLFLCMKPARIGNAVRPRLGPPRDDIADDCLVFSFEMIGPSGYWTELCRMIAGSPPSAALRELAAQGCAAMAAATRHMRPGARMSDIQAATSQALAGTGADLSAWSGHSIGQDVIEQPLIGGPGDTDAVIVEGMAIAYHPLFTAAAPPGLFYMADIFCVGPDGAACCSRWERELYTAVNK